MAVTSFDNSFSFKQDSLARLGANRAGGKPMSADQREAFNNSPFMQGVRKTEDRCWEFTCDRDKQRAQTDPAFKPQDSDFTAAKSHEYDKGIDYYKVLGIDEYAPLDEVKKSYKKLSLVYHPDKSAGLTQDEKDENALIFIELKNAYQTLTDQATRRQYDRDRDRDRANFELNGHKPKKKAHFNAEEVLQKLLENQRPPGATVNVPCAVKLEKFFYGGHKAVIRDRKVEDKFSNKIKSEKRTYRIDVPKGAKDRFEVMFREKGDHHAGTRPDSLAFQVQAKPHEIVSRTGDDLSLKRPLALSGDMHVQPYVTVQTPTVNGRHVLLWGRNPFYGGASRGSAEIRVRIQGEGLTPESFLKFKCSSSIRNVVAAAPVASTKAEGSNSNEVLMTLRNMQTEAKIYLSAKPSSTFGELKRQACAVLQLSANSGMRILKKLPEGYTPYSDAETIGNARELPVAGCSFKEVPFTTDKHVAFLRAVSKLLEGDAFQSKYRALTVTDCTQDEADAELDELWASIAWVMTEFGLEPTLGNLQSQIAVATQATNKMATAFVKKMRETIMQYSTVSVRAPSAGVKPAAGKQAVQRPGQKMASASSLRGFLERHRLAPPGGFDTEVSDGEVEGAEVNGKRHEEKATLPSSTFGRGGKCDAASIQRRVKKLATTALACDLELTPISESIHLFTKPSCTITFYSNARQSGHTPPGNVRPRLVFALALCAPTCAKGKAKNEWTMLKQRLLPVLQSTAFRLFQAARQILPRPLANAPACHDAEHEGSVDNREVPPLPYKRLADDAFKRGEYFTAMSLYTHCASEAEPEDAAIAFSNRAACFAKVGSYKESLEDAKRALDAKPKWGKAWSRAGLAASCMGKPFGLEALHAYTQAVECDPSGAHIDTLSGMVPNVMEIDVDKAHKKKEEGNQALRNNEVGLAVACYTIALALIPKEEHEMKDGQSVPKIDDHTFLRSVIRSNRCGALCKLRSWDLAISDGQKAVASKADFVTAHNKLGSALLGAGHYEQAYLEFASAFSLEGTNKAASRGRETCLGLLPLWKSVKAKNRHRHRFAMDFTRPSTKVYAISDVHFDHRANENWAHNIDDFKFQEDVLIVAGNMCDTRNALKRGLVTFKSKFRRVFYVPGNHEMGIAGEKYPDSFTKLLSIFDLCDELGVDIAPAAVCKGVFIVPLLSWYTAEFHAQDPFPDPSEDADKFCRWPMDKDHQLWKYMLALNAYHLRHLYHGTVITFSHFVPKQTLIGHGVSRREKKTMGCEAIDDQAKVVGSKLHVFGHMKRQYWGKEGDTIYVNHYHGSEDEHLQSNPRILCVWNGSNLRKEEVSVS